MNAAPSTVRAVELDLDRDAPHYPEIAQALEYWRSKKGDRELPSRSDIDPVDLAAMLSRVMMVEVTHDPLEFRYRVVGTGVFAIHGEELTGKRPHDLLPPEFGALIDSHYRAVIARRTPMLHVLQLNIITEYVKTFYARIILPFSEDGKAIDRLITVECYENNLEYLRQFFEKAG